MIAAMPRSWSCDTQGSVGMIASTEPPARALTMSGNPSTTMSVSSRPMPPLRSARSATNSPQTPLPLTATRLPRKSAGLVRRPLSKSSFRTIRAAPISPSEALPDSPATMRPPTPWFSAFRKPAPDDPPATSSCPLARNGMAWSLPLNSVPSTSRPSSRQ